MIQGAFFSAFNFVANNRWAQIVVTAGVIVFVWLMNNRHQRRVGYKRAEAKIEKQSRKVQARVQNEVRQENDDRLEKVNATRDNFRGGTRRASELSDAKRSILIRD